MTANRRIFLNIIATYGRSLYALVLGLYTARWALQALGVVDFGLYGLIGGLTVFVSFFNTVMSGAVSRFYAFGVGAAKAAANKSAALENSQSWFSVAVMIHSALPVILILVGYPLGCWAISHFLTIPLDRIGACVWVWRFSCVSCLGAMMMVPFYAMYIAKQEIAELTIYGFASTTLKAALLWYMVTHPGDWLFRYALYMCVITFVPDLIICIRAHFKYVECRFFMNRAFDIRRIREMMAFAGASFLGQFAGLVSNNGTQVVINKYLGPSANAAMTVGASLCCHAMTLAGAVTSAMTPAIANAAGAKDWNLVRTYCYSFCKYGALMVLVFAVPLSIEADNILCIWLKSPPKGAAMLCCILLHVLVLDKMTDGLSTTIFAFGKIVAYELWIGLIGISVIFMTWGFVGVGYGVASYAVARLITNLPAAIVRLYFARKYADIDVAYWVFHICVKVLVVSALAMVAGGGVRLSMLPSIGRVVLTTLVSEMVLMPLTWFWVMNVDERTYVSSRIVGIVKRVTGKWR